MVGEIRIVGRALAGRSVGTEREEGETGAPVRFHALMPRESAEPRTETDSCDEGNERLPENTKGRGSVDGKYLSVAECLDGKRSAGRSLVV